MKAKVLASCLCTALLTISLYPPRALAEMTGGEVYFQEAEDPKDPEGSEEQAAAQAEDVALTA